MPLPADVIAHRRRRGERTHKAPAVRRDGDERAEERERTALDERRGEQKAHVAKDERGAAVVDSVWRTHDPQHKAADQYNPDRDR